MAKEGREMTDIHTRPDARPALGYATKALTSAWNKAGLGWPAKIH